MDDTLSELPAPSAPEPMPPSLSANGDQLDSITGGADLHVGDTYTANVTLKVKSLSEGSNSNPEKSASFDLVSTTDFAPAGAAAPGETPAPAPDAEAPVEDAAEGSEEGNDQAPPSDGTASDEEVLGYKRKPKSKKENFKLGAKDLSDY